FSGSGTTCIVGPNGCVKSNVVDASSWVLGEQSHKSLRAERMADCIFNATTKRPPLGLAEVTITMEDPELAEAARFVMESAASDSSTDSASTVNENTEISGLTDTTENLSLDPAQTPDTQEAAADASVPSPAEPGGRFKRKRKQADKQVLATKPGEVVVTRRLYRSGQSEYLINGRVGRLRDIQEMFMGVGLGPDSYAIIEQGRIGLILSTKPMERRAIIEEAAGVTKFKTKKRLAEAKLESSKVNLSRVNDIVVEVEKQLGSLKRQAAKERRYSEIREQMRGIVRQMLGGKAREMEGEAARITKGLDEFAAAELQHATAIQQQEGEQDRLNQRVYELDTEIRQNQNQLNLTALEADRAENRISFNTQRAEELAARRGQLSADMSQVSAQASEWRTRSASQQQTVTMLKEEATGLAARVEELSTRAATRATQIAHAETRIESLRMTAAQAGDSLLRLHGEQKQAEEALVHQSEALRRREASEHELLESSLGVRAHAGEAAHGLEAATAQLNVLKQQASALQAKMVSLRVDREASMKKAD